MELERGRLVPRA